MNFPGLPPEKKLRPLDEAKETTQLGTQKLLTAPEGMSNGFGPKFTLIDVQSRCAAGEVLCVSFGIDVDWTPPDSLEIVFPFVRATIQFRAGGIWQEAEVDVLNGTQIAVNAESLRVYVQYGIKSPSWAPVVPTSPPRFKVSASTGYGGNARNSNASRLTDFSMIETPTGKETFIIPKNAISWTLQPTVAGTVTALVRGFGVEGLSSRYSVTGPFSNVGQYSVENAFTIANGMRFLEITNTQESGAQYCYLIWGLSF